jgi:predicted GNAT family acetyltransferase
VALEVTNNEDRSRYELTDGGVIVGVADYSLVGERVVIPHTEIDPRRRGQGMGAVLVQGALDDVRAQGRSVVPACWYVAQYIREHPDYADLVL